MSAVPRPPEDMELRNIIDKLAVFVAKNGPDFEQMTKQKQKDNPKFSFLYGGDNFLYYQYKVTAEQAIMKKQKVSGGGPGPPPALSNILPPQIRPPAPMSQVQVPPGPPPVPTPSVNPEMQAQIKSLETQLSESEKNLKAQHGVLMQQQQTQIDGAIAKVEMERAKSLAGTCGLNLDDFGHILDALALSCTKEAIANGKQWIFNNCQSDRHREIVLLYLLRRIKDATVTSDARLHILYLINDWAHHCMRKKLDPVTQLLQRYVSQMYCYCYKYATDPSSQEKLAKLLALWENHQYFTDNIYKQMQDPKQTLLQFQTANLAEHSGTVNEITQRFQTTYNNYQQQHNDFTKHVQSQIQALQTAQHIAQSFQQQQQQQSQTAAAPAPKRKSRFDNPEPVQKQPQAPQIPLPQGAPQMPPSAAASVTHALPQGQPFAYGGPPPQTQPRFPPDGSVPPQWTQPPPVFGGPPRGMPPFPPRIGGPWPGWRGAPPGVGPPMQGPHMNLVPHQDQQKSEEKKPTVMYYDLPAGLMVPLVGLEDCEYKPIDPKDMRLPPPMPPSDRLMAAVEAFYAPPTHENPRDSEGWEKLGLYEFYKAKGKATQEKKETKKTRSQSHSPASRSRSRTPSPRARSRSRSKSRSKSRSRSDSRSRSKSRSESRSRSRSPSPRGRGRRRSRSPSPDRRRGASFSGPQEYTERISEDNKGHQLMTKMGWGGGGLGAEEQGIRDPVSGGEVRDRVDQFKGVGAAGDPFETYRKQKAGHYVQRIINAQKDREAISSGSDSKKDDDDYDY